MHHLEGAVGRTPETLEGRRIEGGCLSPRQCGGGSGQLIGWRETCCDRERRPVQKISAGDAGFRLGNGHVHSRRGRQ